MTMKNLMAATLLAALPAYAVEAPTPPPAAAKAVDAPPQVAAHLAFVTGSVTTRSGEAVKSLSAGDAVMARQTVIVGPNSYANLRFLDGGSVLLRPDSEFAVESFHYTAAPVPEGTKQGVEHVAAAPADSSAFFRLVRGGFRAISGLIGKNDRSAYRVSTPVATIGIRGTDYEVSLCADDCPKQAAAAAGGVEVAMSEPRGLELAQAGNGGGAGLIAATHAGSITLRTTRGEFNVDAGQVLVALANGQAFALPVIPDAMLQHPAPSPESCK